MKAKLKNLKKEKALNSILGVNIGLPSLSETGVAVMNAENVISAYEKQAQEILKRNGYPITIEELWNKKDKLLPDLANGRGLSQVYSIFWMLWFLKSVRVHIEKNNADLAVCDMAGALHWAITAQLKNIAPFFEMGASLRKRETERRKKRQTWNGLTREQISERNQRIIEHFKKTRLTISRFAEKYGAKYKLKPRTIRLILSRAVGI